MPSPGDSIRRSPYRPDSVLSLFSLIVLDVPLLQQNGVEAEGWHAAKAPGQDDLGRHRSPQGRVWRVNAHPPTDPSARSRKGNTVARSALPRPFSAGPSARLKS